MCATSLLTTAPTSLCCLPCPWLCSYLCSRPYPYLNPLLGYPAPQMMKTAQMMMMMALVMAFLRVSGALTYAPVRLLANSSVLQAKAQQQGIEQSGKLELSATHALHKTQCLCDKLSDFVGWWYTLKWRCSFRMIKYQKETKGEEQESHPAEFISDNECRLILAEMEPLPCMSKAVPLFGVTFLKCMVFCTCCFPCLLALLHPQAPCCCTFLCMQGGQVQRRVCVASPAAKSKKHSVMRTLQFKVTK